MSFKNLVHEVHRRSLWQVLGIYVAGSWLALQVVETLDSAYGLPEWFPPAALGLLVVGLPIVLATAFVQEGTGREAPAGATPGDASPETRSASGAEAHPAPRLGEAGAPAPDVSAETSPTRATGHRRLFTWRNAILGGVGAFAVLGVVTGGYLAMRSLGIGPAGTLVAKGVMEAEDPIVLAEFEDRTGDSTLAATITEALRIDLAQSPAITLVEPDELAAALRRMERDPDTRLDYGTARELAIREGIKAVVAGEVSPLGGSFVLTARLHATEDGEILVPVRETAKDSTEIISAVDALSRHLRERIGESLKSVGSRPPLRRVTTASLPALRKYSQGLREGRSGNQFRGAELMREAIALDTSFSQAYLDLAVYLSNMGIGRSEQVAALRRAFEHRERLPDEERYFTEASYYGIATGESEKAIPAYRSLVEMDPDHEDAANDLGFEYMLYGDPEKALEWFEFHLERHPDETFTKANIVNALIALGRVDEAWERAQAYLEEHPGHPSLILHAARAAYAHGDPATTERLAGELREGAGPDAPGWWPATWHLANLRLLEGKLGAAEGLVREILDRADRIELPTEYIENAAWLERIGALPVRPEGLVAPTPRPLPALEAAVERYPLEEMDPLDRPVLRLAEAYAAAGHPGRAREFLAAFEEDVPEEYRGTSRIGLQLARGYVALAEDRPEEAIREFRESATRGCTRCGLAEIAVTWEELGRTDSARVTWERFLETPQGQSLGGDATWKAAAFERLGRLWDEAGDLEKAALYYGKFTELWADADPELQPRVEAARARLEAILAERG